jgi:hypothetical protein
LANLKSHLIIRIAKGQAVDRKPETHGGDEKDWDVRVSKQEQHESLQFDAFKEAGREKWSTVIPLFYLSQFDAQYIGKLCRYFKKLMGDFGPHQTKCIFLYLFPYPLSTPVIFAAPRVTYLSGAMEDGCR